MELESIDHPASPEIAGLLKGLFESAPDPILLVGADGKIIRANHETEKVFGYTREELQGQPVEILIPECHRKHHVAERNGYISNPHVRSMGTGLNIRGRRKNGSEIPLDIMLSPMGEGEKRVTIAIVRDITEQRDLQEAIMQVSEKEKHRIGLEIHDDLCQSLVAVTLLAHSLHESLAARGLDEEKDAKQVVELLNEVNSHARDMARGLAAVNLMGGTFQTAVEDLASRISKRSNIECSVDINMSEDFPGNNVATHFFRIIQQAVNNALQHSGASSIGISLLINTGSISLTIKDNGTGVSEDLSGKKGMGLMIMQYRAQMIGASLSISRRPEGGTEVACSLPLAT